MSFVQLNDLTVTYQNDTTILKQLNLAIEKGELVSLLGPSGCGKTTTLRIIAGLIKQSSGTFTLNGKEMTNIPVHKRQFGMVFQSYALFPHLTVFDNVAFGLKLKKVPKEDIAQKVNDMLTVCGLNDLHNRYPKQLSGGQRQRVALARALVIEPELLLLDEPLSNLDAKLRVQMRLEIKRIQQQLQLTTIFVTHDQEECFSISDKVAVMNNGLIEQFDTPEMIYTQPKTEFVARFIGFDNFFNAKRLNNVYTIGQSIVLSTEKMAHHTADEVLMTIRPDDICITTDKTNALFARVRVRTFLGKSYQYEVDTEIGCLRVNANEQFNNGDSFYITFPENKLVSLN